MNYRIKRQAGLTLVELMVATTLSLVLLAGVLLVFSAKKTTYQMQTGLGTLPGERSIRDEPDHCGSANGWLRWLPSVTPYRSTHHRVGE